MVAWKISIISIFTPIVIDTSPAFLKIEASACEHPLKYPHCRDTTTWSWTQPNLNTPVTDHICRDSPKQLRNSHPRYFPAPTPYSPDWKSGRRVFELLTPRQQQHSSVQIAFVSIACDDGDMINDDGWEDDKACGLFNCLQSDRLKFDMRIPYRKAPTLTYPACGMALGR